MQAFILAAGIGERMRPLTDTTPKPLLKVGNYSLIEHNIIKLAASGITSIIINTCYLGEKIQQQLGNGGKYGVKIQYSPEPTRLGPGGAIIQAKHLLNDKHFILLAGDIWTDFSFATLKNKIQHTAHIVLVDNPPFHPEGDFGISNGLATNTEPKLNFAGISVWHPRAFTGCPGHIYGLSQFIEPLIQTNDISAEYFIGKWRNIGTPEQLANLQASEV